MSTHCYTSKMPLHGKRERSRERMSPEGTHDLRKDNVSLHKGMPPPQKISAEEISPVSVTSLSSKANNQKTLGKSVVSGARAVIEQLQKLMPPPKKRLFTGISTAVKSSKRKLNDLHSSQRASKKSRADVIPPSPDTFNQLVIGACSSVPAEKSFKCKFNDSQSSKRTFKKSCAELPPPKPATCNQRVVGACSSAAAEKTSKREFNHLQLSKRTFNKSRADLPPPSLATCNRRVVGAHLRLPRFFTSCPPKSRLKYARMSFPFSDLHNCALVPTELFSYGRKYDNSMNGKNDPRANRTTQPKYDFRRRMWLLVPHRLAPAEVCIRKVHGPYEPVPARD